MSPLPADEQSEEQPAQDFKAAMLSALCSTQLRKISPRYLYDAVGSKLFESICEQPEYYLTALEIKMLKEHGASIAKQIGPKAELIEFGAGSTRKIQILLSQLNEPLRYVPIDISETHLLAESEALRESHPWLDVQPVVADFMKPFQTGESLPGTQKRVGLYLGSSIGNFDTDGMRAFLKMAANLLPGGALLIGFDLIKDPAVLHAAYNDAAGMTAAFNLNLLMRSNRELKTDFNPDHFFHHAHYNPQLQCIEMHLISKHHQVVHLDQLAFEFKEGEPLHTESSHKFTLKGFAALTAESGWRLGPCWTDPRQWFALQWLHQADDAQLAGGSTLPSH